MEKTERKWQFYSVLFKMEFFYYCFGQIAASERTFHWCHVYTCMLIKTFDIYIFQKHWQTPRISLDPIRILFCRLRVRACTFVKYLFTFYSHVHSVHMGYWSLAEALDRSGIFYSTKINFSFCYSLPLRYIHSNHHFHCRSNNKILNTYILPALCFEAMRFKRITSHQITSYSAREEGRAKSQIIIISSKCTIRCAVMWTSSNQYTTILDFVYFCCALPFQFWFLHLFGWSFFLRFSTL